MCPLCSLCEEVVAWRERSNGVQVSFSVFIVVFADVSSAFQTVVVMLELKWGQQKKIYHYFLPNSIVDGVPTSQMLQTNLSWRYLRLPGGFIIFWLRLDPNYSFLSVIAGTIPENTLIWCTFLFVFFLQFAYFYSQYLIAVSRLCGTCSHHLWTWSLW